ncbi:MAG: hypothetical protein ACRD7E_28610, partial [Bryobacteraceae bacterium]
EFLDGEGGRTSRWRIQMHLFRCWECCGRKADLEAQPELVAPPPRAVVSEPEKPQVTTTKARSNLCESTRSRSKLTCIAVCTESVRVQTSLC